MIYYFVTKLTRTIFTRNNTGQCMKYYIPHFANCSILILSVLLISNNLYAQKDGYELVWHDEFNGSELDTTKWKHRGLGTRRGGTVTKDAISLDGEGNLLITTSITDSNNYFVGMIGTQETYNTTYGYFEARVKFGKRLSWDSFWLQCPTAYQAGPPSETGAEIDIFEYTRGVKRLFGGWDDDGNVIYDTLGYEINHDIHWADNDGNMKGWGSHSSVVNDVSDYVTVAVKWTEKNYIFFVNDVMTYSTVKGVSGIDEYIILSVEPYFWEDLPDSIRNGATVQDTFFVDYVRVYKKIQTDVETIDNEIPNSFLLSQNYPNPFNPTTTIDFAIPSDNFVTLKVFDTMGREVSTLVNENKKADSYSVHFDASNLSSGIYYYKLVVGSSFTQTKKMILLR